MSVIMPHDEEKPRNSIDERAIEKPTETTGTADALYDSDSDNELKTKDNSDSDDQDDDDEDTIRLDPKEMLIVKDGTIKVAHPYQEPEPQYDANGELIKASGTWTQVEHERFLKAIQTYPKGPWKAIAAMVGSRTVRQTQTHAQKYREKMARRLRGLRNRNGTLQTPPMRLSQLVATSPMYGQLVMPAMQYTHRPQSLGMNGVEYLPVPQTYMTTSPTHTMVETPHGMRPALPTDIYYSPTHGYHQYHHVQQHPHSHVASPPGVAMEYESSYKHHHHNQQQHHHHSSMPPKTPPTPASDLQPTPWTENAPKVLVPAPDYAESMDFLMNFYSIDPNHPAAHAHLLQAQQQHYANSQAQQSSHAASTTS